MKAARGRPPLAARATGFRRPAWLVALVLLLPPQALHAQRAPTTQTGIGIFYRPGAPETGSLWREGDAGERLALGGRVLDTRGRPVAGARVELWHADAAGSVDATRYRATRRSGAHGRFAVRTVLPGHIPMARYNSVFAPRHIHVMVTHPDHPRLVSLIFFKGDEPLARSPYPGLAIALERSRGDSGEVLVGGVELVLGAQPLPAQEWHLAD
jgi:protocatechuate 3,4-dioxygenase beta subunit